MHYVFDLDGTLIDNEQAVREAYFRAGVIVPEDAWGQPRGEWCTSSQALIKADHYEHTLKEFASAGPALFFWKDLLRCKMALPLHIKMNIVTGASIRGACTALEFLGIDTTFLYGMSCTVEKKAEIIRSLTLSTDQDRVVYVDSDLKVALLVKGLSDCNILVPE